MSDRGHVPFALLGVLLLVASVTLAAPVGTPNTSEPAVDREMERLTAEASTTLREASLVAAREAARSPVTAPAETEAGAAIRNETAFEDALRLRVYVNLRRGLDRLSASRHGLSVGASLPDAGTPEAMREARDSIGIRRAGENGTKLRVTVENVTLTASRGGRTVAKRQVSPTVVVDSPVLAVHDRVETFERQLDASVFDPGLGRRLTARLYPVAWARGYAQYSGVPIQNVVANRHVALVANGAVLDIQRETFGHSDPVGRETLRRTTRELAVTDLLSGTDSPAAQHLLDAREYAGLERTPAESLERFEPDSAHPSPHATATVGLDETADRVFVRYLPALEDTIRETYSEDVRLDASVSRTGREVAGDRSPGGSFTLEDEHTRTTATATGRTADPPPAPDGWHRLAFHPREVELVTTTVRRWNGSDGTRTTRYTERETYAVDVSLLGRHSNGPAPAAPIGTVHERGGPFDGQNLADVPDRAREQLVAKRGGPDELAIRAARGELGTDVERVYGEYPDELRGWVYDDITALREEVGEIATTNDRSELATLEANVARQLLDRLEARRGELVDAPAAYDNVSHRAAVGARVAYLDRLAAWLRLRADQHDRNRERLAERLPDGSWDRLKQGPPDQPRSKPAGSAIRMRVDTGPSYLTREAVGNRVVPSLPPERQEHPLVVRNVNLISAPYDEVADWLVRLVLGPERVELRTAAEVLRATERIADATATPAGSKERSDEAFEVARQRLHDQVASGVEHAIEAAVAVLADYGLGDRASREAAVRAGLAEWNTTAGRALALSNGSAARVIEERAIARWSGDLSEREAGRLALELEWGIRNAVTDDEASPTVGTVRGADDRAHETLRETSADLLSDGLQNATERTVRRTTGRALSSFPLGIPVAPPPGLWYATVNTWHVEIRGEYPRVSVHVPRGAPDGAGGELVYVRDGSPSRLDVTGDGKPELLGRSTRVSFATRADVAVAVPPGPRGVGDVDGERTEESPGWPEPGSG